MLSSVDMEHLVSYELITGNPLWRLGLVLLGIMLTLAVGKLLQFACLRVLQRNRRRSRWPMLTSILESLLKPMYVTVFAIGLNICKSFIVFDNPATETVEGLDPSIHTGWTVAVKIVLAFAIGYAAMKLVDVLEIWLMKAADRTVTSLDNMLVPILRKSMRITIILITALFIMDVIVVLENLKTVLVGAGVGGLAIALAAKETIANLFGSITIFADRPFQIGDLVQIEGHLGFVEDVGIRSTRMRTWDGHMITLPNGFVINANIDNLSARPAIRRMSDITITYDAGPAKAEQAVAIIKAILAETPEVDTHPHRTPRVYFNEFNSASLNILMIYWVTPADWWLFQAVNEKINLEMMRRFAQAGIEFAFPTQTLYLKKNQKPAPGTNQAATE